MYMKHLLVGPGQSLRVQKTLVEGLYEKLSKHFKVEMPKPIRTDLFEIVEKEVKW